MTKYINSYADENAFNTEIPSFSYPHVGYLQTEDEVKYDKDPGNFYQIWGTVTDGTTSLTLNINGSTKSATVNNGYFMYNWTGGTITKLYTFLYNNPNVKTVKKIGVDTSNVTNMHEMFYSCKNLTSIDVSNLNTSECTDMGSMFVNCINLTSLDVSNFNTSRVTDMRNMFFSCFKLTSLDVSNFNASNVTTMSGMFRDCNNLTSIGMSGWNTSGGTNMTNMFNSCRKLTSITMNNTNQTTLEKIQGQLVSDNVASHVTITRDGYNWTYSGGQWVSTPI